MLVGPQVIHERWVVSHVTDEEYAVVTPDEDIYTEQLSILNDDLRSIYRVRPGPGRLPLGIVAANVYTLPAWNAADKARLQAAAEAEAAAEKGEAWHRSRWGRCRTCTRGCAGGSGCTSCKC